MKNKKVNFDSILQLLDNFPDEKTCREHFEQYRWPDGKPTCPHYEHERVYRFRDGKLFKCAKCRKKFTVTVGTIFESTHVPLRKWFMAIYLLTAHKKGISSLQLSKDIHVTQATAWFMLHRIRYMCSQSKGVLLCNVVEVDEAYFGGKPKKGDRKLDDAGNFINKRGRGTEKTAVVGMVERQGNVVATPVSTTDSITLQALVKLNIVPGATVITDEYRSYTGLDSEYEHKRINHSARQYSDQAGTHVNTIEGFWSLMKRGFVGIYHYMSPKHLDLYCDEFTFRYSTHLTNEQERFNRALTQSEGRIMYKDLKSKDTKPVELNLLMSSVNKDKYGRNRVEQKK